MRNPRRNDDAVDRMCGAIAEFGFRIPIVARSNGNVVDGHLQLKAARRLGFPSVAVVLADGLSEQQIKAFRLLANQSANWAEWDEELLRLELQDASFDLDLTGFGADEIEHLLAEVGDEGTERSNEDDVPQPPAEPVTLQRFHKTMLDEFYRIAFRKKIYATIEDLQTDLDLWMREYNEARPHQGNWCYGKTPMQTFIDTTPLARKKPSQTQAPADQPAA